MTGSESWGALMDKLHYQFQNEDLCRDALTHSSFANERPKQAPTDNERLEFLGDAVLRLAATEFIDRCHPNLPIGDCSSLRAQLVSDRWLADVGKQTGLEPLIILGSKTKGDLAARSTLCADTCEALIGALYMSCGTLEPVHRWLTPYWQTTSRSFLENPHLYIGKTTLQEWTQARGLGLPTYMTSEQSHSHGDPRRFLSRVQIGNTISAEGWGGSRKEAEQQAALAALQSLEEL